ncbi:MAG: hypothetical protein JST46_04325 [Bacteroidetes bacterium]|nr:hypothetical protein [Bacteroidota bacterium]
MCAIAGKIISEQSIDLSFESRMVGKCNVAIDHSILPKALRADPGEYLCDFGKMVILTDDMFFAENVRYAVQIERLRMRGTRKIIKYKIVQFFHDARNKDFGKKVISKEKVVLPE